MIIVTKHAIERLKLRFFFYFPVSCFYTEHDTRSFIHGQLSKAKKCVEWSMSPFYKNKISTKYGLGIEVYYRKPVFYICRRFENNLMVLTVVKEFHGENIE